MYLLGGAKLLKAYKGLIKLGTHTIWTLPNKSTLSRKVKFDKTISSMPKINPFVPVSNPWPQHVVTSVTKVQPNRYTILLRWYPLLVRIADVCVCLQSLSTQCHVTRMSMAIPSAFRKARSIAYARVKACVHGFTTHIGRMCLSARPCEYTDSHRSTSHEFRQIGTWSRKIKVVVEAFFHILFVSRASIIEFFKSIFPHACVFPHILYMIVTSLPL